MVWHGSPLRLSGYVYWMRPMHIDVIVSLEKLNTLKETWEAVYDADPEAQFFLSWPWISRWLQAAKSHWLVLAVKTDADASTYVAFFPLRYRVKKTANGKILKELVMAGNSAADYTGFLCVPGCTDSTISIFATAIKKLDWDSLHLENICAWNKNNALFLEHFHEQKFIHKHIKNINQRDNIDNTVCPYLDLPNNWQSYLKNSLNSNMRRKVRRYLDAIDNSDDFRITIPSQHTIRRDIEILLRFWAMKWGERKGNNLTKSLNIYRVMIMKSFSERILFMPILWHGDEPVGALACFADEKNKSLLMYVAGRDPSAHKPPPGLLLNAYCIKKAIENGYKTYDFLRGNEPYKYLFGAKDRLINYIQIEPKNAGRM